MLLMKHNNFVSGSLVTENSRMFWGLRKEKQCSASDSRKRTSEQDRSTDRLEQSYSPLSASNALSEDEDDNETTQKTKDKPSLNIRKIKEEEEFSQKILFGKQEELKVLSEFQESQCACVRLDKQQGKLTPKEPWFWPKLIISDDEDDSDNECSGSTLKAKGMDTKFLTDDEKLKILTSYLRENHFYCIWFRAEYNDRKDLLSECLGPCREDSWSGRGICRNDLQMTFFLSLVINLHS
ncbi:G patch domain-containing protein 11-like [Protopterus annectens]|uniref:G patch domain-containing protein 11-like n=1 Tax=Protopterus annectens TaxID=7888 RepID=UPI001CFC05C8|nr:G patch domain-containing protein 11-like [Protopterus annectens]